MQQKRTTSHVPTKLLWFGTRTHHIPTLVRAMTTSLRQGQGQHTALNSHVQTAFRRIDQQRPFSPSVQFFFTTVHDNAISAFVVVGNVFAQGLLRYADRPTARVSNRRLQRTPHPSTARCFRVVANLQSVRSDTLNGAWRGWGTRDERGCKAFEVSGSTMP